ncbi:MAG: stage II sporulation protein M [Gloeomargarita sp. HHBFW_bins_162]
MDVKRWLSRREKDWQELKTLLERLEQRGLGSLSAGEIRRLASLYRIVSGDLARARTFGLSPVLIQDLQNLTSRSYSQIYQGSRRREWQAVGRFYRWELPQVLRATWMYWTAAAGIFALGGLIGWWYGWQDGSFQALLLPQYLINQVRERGELWTGSILGVEPWAASNIMVNNLSVAFRAVAGGITGGLLTIYFMFLNGLLLGVVGSLVGEHGLAYPFWAFVAPHGALELPAIVLSGGAGLLIGRALLFPGKWGRATALQIYGAQAAQLVYGIVPLLVIAGVIEGFFSPSEAIPAGLKYLVGLALLANLVWYGLWEPPVAPSASSGDGQLSQESVQ